MTIAPPANPSGGVTVWGFYYPSAQGIDVSANNYNGQAIDWNQVSTQGLSFIYMRATLGEGDSSATDADFTPSNINGALFANLKVGAYHVAYPNLTASNTASNEATWFVQHAGNCIKSGYLRPALDLEKYPSSSMTSSQYVTWVNKWMSTVKSMTGIEPIIYTQSSFINDHQLTDLYNYGYDLWVSDPNPVTKPRTAPWTNWHFWQYDVRQVPGIPGGTFNGQTGVTDLDVFNGGLSDLSEYEIKAVPFVRGMDGGLWYKNFDGTSWSGWQNLAGQISILDTISSGSNVYAFARSSLDGNLWYRKWDYGTAWGGWQSLGGPVTDIDAIPTS